VSFAWGRVFFCFGPHEPAGRLVPSVARALLAGSEAPVTHGRQLRDFLAVEQLGDAFAALLDCAVQGAVNVASGQPVALRELVELVARATGRPELVRFGAVDPRPGEPPELVADVARLADEVGWRPHEPLEAGVERAVAWWRAAPAA
jgi:nucleoside-diphosphate-sugar epimerase